MIHLHLVGVFSFSFRLYFFVICDFALWKKSNSVLGCWIGFDRCYYRKKNMCSMPHFYYERKLVSVHFWSLSSKDYSSIHTLCNFHMILLWLVLDVLASDSFYNDFMFVVNQKMDIKQKCFACWFYSAPKHSERLLFLQAKIFTDQLSKGILTAK